MPEENQARTNSTRNSREPTAKGRITPELVRQVAERVYSMLRGELIIERERSRTSSVRRIGGLRR